MTPGREEDEVESKLYTRKDYNTADQNNLSEQLVAALGGVENISDIGCCATRLRLSVNDSSKVDKELLKQTKASGVLVSGNGVQVIYGPKVTVIKSDLEEYVKSLKNGN
jgi:glucose-like phosphotransferase system IIB component